MIAAILACAAIVSGAQGIAQLQHADDLAATAAKARAGGLPILLAFTAAGCPYCARARNEYLLPLQSGAAYGSRVVIREIDIRSTGALRGFSGESMSPASLARRYRVTRVPTVIVVDYDGKPLAEPIVGLLAEDFYLLYLERAIDAGHLALKK